MKPESPSAARTPAAEAFTALILETFRLNGRLLAAGDGLTKSLDLTSALWQVLGAIDATPLSMAQIAREMGLARQSVRRSVTVLIERGFVAFRSNPDHQRAKLVALTAEGRTVLRRTTNRQVVWANALTADIDPRELDVGARLLRRLAERIDAQ